MKEVFNRRARVYYSSGATAQDLGKWFDSAVRDVTMRYGAVAIGENDFGEFDGSQGQCKRNHNARRYKEAGAPKHVMKAITATRMRGASRIGVKFSSKAKKSSGETDTSCGNSELNIDSTLDLVVGCSKSVGLDPRCSFWLVFLGDDMLLIAPPQLVRAVCAIGEAHFRALGLEAKLQYKEHLIEAEYCSGRFYLTASGSRVWAPKIGRSLTKAGWRLAGQLNVTDAEWVAGVMGGLYADANHVPVLRAMGRPGNRILRGQRTPSVRVEYPTLESYEELARLYGTSVTELQALEGEVAHSAPGTFLPDTMLLRKILARDVAPKRGHPRNNRNWLFEEGYELLWPMSAIPTESVYA